MKKDYSLDNFRTAFGFCIAAAVACVVFTVISVITGEGYLIGPCILIIPVLCAVNCLLSDILFKKGYFEEDDIPIFRIVLLMGVFAFLYVIALPDKNSNTVSLEKNISNKNISANQTSNKVIKNGDYYWVCPECDTKNIASSRMCKDCGYQK